MIDLKSLLAALLIASAAPAAQAAPMVSAVGAGAPPAEMLGEVSEVSSARDLRRSDAGVVTVSRMVASDDAARSCDAADGAEPFDMLVERYDASGALTDTVEYQGAVPTSCRTSAIGDQLLVEMSFAFDAALRIE